MGLCALHCTAEACITAVDVACDWVQLVLSLLQSFLFSDVERYHKMTFVRLFQDVDEVHELSAVRLLVIMNVLAGFSVFS
jgi:hypothetical protein